MSRIARIPPQNYRDRAGSTRGGSRKPSAMPHSAAARQKDVGWRGACRTRARRRSTRDLPGWLKTALGRARRRAVADRDLGFGHMAALRSIVLEDVTSYKRKKWGKAGQRLGLAFWGTSWIRPYSFIAVSSPVRPLPSRPGGKGPGDPTGPGVLH